MALDKFLNSEDGLMQGGDPNSGVQFDSGNERSVITNVAIKNASISTAKIGTAQITHALIGTAAIGTANIGTLTFNEIEGGTARLGGTANGEGLLQIFDAGGTKIIQGDNLGHHYYGTNGSESIRVDKNGLFGIGTTGGTTLKVTNGLLQLFNDAGDQGVSQLNSSFLFTNNFPLIWGANSLFLRGSSGGADIFCQTGELQIDATDGPLNLFANNSQIIGGTNGSVFFNDPINVGGFEKSAVVDTSDGYRALYCTESPEVWFMDFCESKNKIDPLFLEVTSPPYHFIKCEDGEYQVWGIRKGYENKRFESKTKEEAEHNNRFWLQAKITKEKPPVKLSVKPHKIDTK